MHANEQLVRVCLAAISKADADGWLASYVADAVSRDVPLDSVWSGRAELEARGALLAGRDPRHPDGATDRLRGRPVGGL